VTILLYMSEVESGGETVFPRAEPALSSLSDGAAPLSSAEVIEALRKSGEIAALPEGSWEESLTAVRYRWCHHSQLLLGPHPLMCLLLSIQTCRTRFSVKPKAGRAVLFYSQHPNGAYDVSSLHGACPVLNGTKWASNLWVWSAPRHEFEYAPRKRPEEDRRVPRPVHTQLLAEFRNTGGDPSLNEAELYYNEDTHFGKLGPNDPPIAVNTYEGHVWHIKVNGEIQRTFVIEDKPRQVFKV
jgi:2OG-Fe(II) oxygenase superfamily